MLYLELIRKTLNEPFSIRKYSSIKIETVWNHVNFTEITVWWEKKGKNKFWQCRNIPLWHCQNETIHFSFQNNVSFWFFLKFCIIHYDVEWNISILSKQIVSIDPKQFFFNFLSDRISNFWAFVLKWNENKFWNVEILHETEFHFSAQLFMHLPQLC